MSAYKKQILDLTFFIYWKDGKCEVIRGTTVEQAFLNMNYGPDKVPLIHSFGAGRTPTLKWNPENQSWESIETQQLQYS